MTADPAFGHLTPLRGASHFRAPSLGDPRSRPRRGGIGRAPYDLTAHRRRHSGLTHVSSFQDVDLLSYSAEESEEHATPCEPHDNRVDRHDVMVLELSDDSSDDHWALAPEQIDELTCEGTGNMH